MRWWWRYALRHRREPGQHFGARNGTTRDPATLGREGADASDVPERTIESVHGALELRKREHRNVVMRLQHLAQRPHACTIAVGYSLVMEEQLGDCGHMS